VPGQLTAVAALVAAAGAVAWAQTPAEPEHARSRSYNVALGVGCEHCHVDRDYANASKTQLDFAARMARMVRGLNEGPLQALGGVTCWSCHRGHTAPPRLPRADWESIAAAYAPPFAGRDALGLTMSVYSASLGVGCTHCHVEGDWESGAKRAHRTVATMSTIFELIPTYFDSAVRAPRTQCYMCHQGHIAVERSHP